MKYVWGLKDVVIKGLLAKEYDEEKHVRDAHGRFTSTGSPEGGSGEIGVEQISTPGCGGSYGHVLDKVGGPPVEVHHIPPKSVNQLAGLSKYKGPAVALLRDDHLRTNSWGSTPKAKAYRELQANLVKQGKFLEAQKMDIDELQSKFGSKYDNAIDQVRAYTTQLCEGKVISC